MKKIILASQSPRRKEQLESIGLKFKVVKSNYDEKFNPRLGPASQAEFLSREKAKVVAQKFPKAIIIGADQVVSIGSEILGKPKDRADAIRVIKKLQGKTHSVWTGITLIDTEKKKTITKSVVTKVTMRKLTTKEIESFIEKEPVILDAAGSYTIRGYGALIVEKIEGDYQNVVGLPLFAVAQELKKLGVKIL